MKYRGTPVSRGYAVAKAYIHKNAHIAATERALADPSEAEDAVLSYKRAKAQVKKQLEETIVDFQTRDDSSKADIFEAHLKILCDSAVVEDILKCIKEELWAADWAVQKVFYKYASMMERSRNKLFRERAADFRDVSQRLLLALAGAAPCSLSSLKEPCIVVTHELLPSDTANIDRINVLGIITEIGGDTSHSAILARSLDIPAVLGVKDICSKVNNAQDIILDAMEGYVYTSPDPVQVAVFSVRADEHQADLEQMRQYCTIVPVTTDGVRVQVLQNLGSALASDMSGSNYVDGVGLFRTEYLYMSSNHMPTEEEQFEAYRRVLSIYKDRPVTLRTLDIGGDKTLPYLSMEKELNPFLGERAVRLCFNNPEMFMTQLRAALRASVFGNLWLMFPMIGTIDDILRAKAMLEQAKLELSHLGLAYSDNVKVGVMIEIPSVAIIADIVAEEVDFASIGSNDLIQYTLAVDRMNQKVSEFYQNFNPAVLRLIGNTAQQFNNRGKPICVCGELAGNPDSALLLMGLGIRNLSMNISSIAEVKRMISTVSMKTAEATAKAACNMRLAKDIKELTRSVLSDSKYELNNRGQNHV
jgi:phosphotransferase system enzyme I (PtsI)